MQEFAQVAGAAVADPTASARARHGHYAALDGLRAVAFLAVFVGHYWSMVVPGSAFAWGGWLGVDLFFVLSGFLITGILYDSLEKPRYFRNFYIRRALRIFPLYYTPWILFLILTPWLHPLWTRFDIARVFYYGNLMDFVAAHHPEIEAGAFHFYFPPRHLTGFNTGALWSLCLEEQFYLAWPLLVFLLRDRRRIMTLCSVAIPVSLTLNLLLSRWADRTGVDRSFLYNATYTHAGVMLFGAWTALWLRGRPAGRSVAPPVYASLILVPALTLGLAIVYVVGNFDLLHPIIPTLGYLCSGLLSTGLVIACIQPTGPLPRLLSQRWLTHIGAISYGLYIFHGYLMGSFRHHLHRFAAHRLAWTFPLAAFAVTYAAALLSYHFLELPFLRLKDRFASPSPGRALPPGLSAPNHVPTSASDAVTG